MHLNVLHLHHNSAFVVQGYIHTPGKIGVVSRSGTLTYEVSKHSAKLFSLRVCISVLMNVLLFACPVTAKLSHPQSMFIYPGLVTLSIVFRYHLIRQPTFPWKYNNCFGLAGSFCNHLPAYFATQ